MKRILVIASLFLSLFTAHGKIAAEPALLPFHEKAGTSIGNQRKFSVHVAAGDWGNANPKTIETLLNAVTAELLTHFPGRALAPIEVFPTRHRPVVLYQKGPANQYQVFLPAKDKRWGEYIYEYSHELFHILANYESHAPPGKAHHRWFEEMMCEAASLYTLKRFSSAWKSSAPHSEWAAYAPALNKYTQRALKDPHRHLPENASFAQWFREHERSFFGNPYLRSKNETVAMRFLPLLEQNADWTAIAYLNPPIKPPAMTFNEYLAGWYKNTPTGNRELVVHTMNLFEFPIPAEGENLSIAQRDRTEMTPSRDINADTDASEREAGAAGYSRP